ncbi:Type V secretory pathway, adhesin AidA [Magnetospirillum sp. SS-4]|nr:Type V secretory pathway, adhesin AidA [Magnetospirillum sp. SS-4]
MEVNGSFDVTNHGGSAGYHNTYGYYVMDENGHPTAGEIIWKDVHDSNGQTVTIEGVDPDSVGFFIIPNGDQNASIQNGSDVTFSQDASGRWQVLDGNGQVLSGTGTKVLFDNASLNSDGLGHMVDTSQDGGNQNWEDLNGGGDNDFNDLNMTVSWNEAEPTSTHEVNVSANFSDMDGSESHSVVLSGLPAGAVLMQDGVALVPGADGSYSLDPANLDGLTVTTPPGFTGELSVSVNAVSVDGDSVATATASAEVTLDLGNETPDAGDAESVTTITGNAVTGQVEATDADGNQLNFALATGNDGPQHGSVVLNPDGTFTYTPTGNFIGSDTFKVVIDDGHGGTTTETVTVNVESNNQGPIATDDSTIDMVAQGPALAVDIGEAVVTEGQDGAAARWDGLAAMTDPTTATTTTNYGTDLNSNYGGTSNADLVGVGRDNNASISTGNGDDQVTIGRDVNGNIDLGNGVNALDVGDDVNASVSAGSGNDTVRVGDDLNGNINLGNGDNRLEVGGDANSSITAGSGDDDVKIGGDVNSQINLGSGNDDLHIGGDVNASINAGQGDDRILVGDDVSAKIDLGSGNDYLEVRDNTWASIDAGQGDDTVILGGDISAKVDMGTGDDHLTITGQNLWATVTGGAGNDSIELTGVTKAQWDANANGIKNYVKDFENIKFSDGQVIGDASAFTGGESTPDTYEYPLTVTAALNDTDGSESLSVVTIDNLPAGATLMQGDTTLTANDDGTYSIQVASGQPVELTVVSNEPLDLSGLTTSVTATEANGGDTATTTVTGEGGNAGETMVDESIATAEDRALTLNASDLLANDSDPDGGTLSITGVGNATNGTVSMDETGAITFTPDPDFHGTATFEYTVSDGQGGTDTATVTMRVDDVNDAPVIESVSGGSGFENTAITGGIEASDVDGDSLSFTLAGGNDGPQHGSVELQPDGSFTYTPATNYVGEDSFTVIVSDGRGGTTSETITVTVAEANAAPVIDASRTTATVTVDYSAANTSNIGKVAATDADGDRLTYTVLDGDQNGSLYLDADSGSFFYNADDTTWSGTDVFSVQVSDGQGGLTTQTITVNVTGGSGGGSQSAGHVIGWGNGGGREESWGPDGSWTVGGSGGGHANNGYGNGDQDAPGNSGDHNNAENGGSSGGGRGRGGSSGGGRGRGGSSGGGRGHGGSSGGGRGHGGSSGGGHGHGGSAGAVVQASDDGTNWGKGWRAVDVGNEGHSGTGDTISIKGYNRHDETYSGNEGDTLVGAEGRDYMSLEGADGQQKISGFDHIQLGDGDHVILDMTTTRYDYGDLTVAGGSGHDVIWSAGGDDLLVAGNGGNTIHGGGGDDTIVAGAGADDLMGQDGSDLFLFDFGTGHDVVNGGAGGNWTDTIDLSTNMEAGATITITAGDNSWTVQSDGDSQSAGTIQLGQDKGGTITVHSDQGDQTIEFTNIEAIKF